MPVVQNRFFVKENRFELSLFLVRTQQPVRPTFRRWHRVLISLNEQLAHGFLGYHQTQTDLKGLTKTLINISRSTNEGGNQTCTG